MNLISNFLTFKGLSFLWFLNQVTGVFAGSFTSYHNDTTSLLSSHYNPYFRGENFSWFVDPMLMLKHLYECIKLLDVGVMCYFRQLLLYEGSIWYYNWWCWSGWMKLESTTFKFNSTAIQYLISPLSQDHLIW